MAFLARFLVVVSFIGTVFCASVDVESTKLCRLIHHLDRGDLPSVVGFSSEDGCRLECASNESSNAISLSLNGLNEGYPCPKNSKGICRNGQCQDEFLRAYEICDLFHEMDRWFDENKTLLLNDECTVQCAPAGEGLPKHFINEGKACPGNYKGVCKSGQCVTGLTPTPTFKIYRLQTTIKSAIFKTPQSSLYTTISIRTFTRSGVDINRTPVSSETKSSSVTWNTVGPLANFLQNSTAEIEIDWLNPIKDHQQGFVLAQNNPINVYTLLNKHLKEETKKLGEVEFVEQFTMLADINDKKFTSTGTVDVAFKIWFHEV